MGIEVSVNKNIGRRIFGYYVGYRYFILFLFVFDVYCIFVLNLIRYK